MQASVLSGTPAIAARQARAAKVVRPHAAPLRTAAQTARSARTAVRVQASVATTTPVKELQATFGKAGAVEVVEGRGGLPTVQLKHSSGATAEVTLFGGCVTSWKTSGGQEVLYIRPDAVFDKSKPISGGIPHCFPQFGPGPIQLHGFARNVDWQLAGSSAGAEPSVKLVLTESDYTKAMWPRSFKVEYTVTLAADALHTEVKVLNTDAQEFDFTASLHSYFAVTDIETAYVTGLQGLPYLDRVKDAKHPSVHKEEREKVRFSGPVDYVYLMAKNPVALDDGKGTVCISSTNWPDVVVWTPWTAMEACYKEFVCVENAQCGQAVVLQPGESWTARTQFSFASDPLEEFCDDNPDADECKVFDE